jgi:uncharacterized protein (UPF0333 family)
MKHQFKGEGGAVLIFSLMVLVVLVSLSAAVTLRTVFEANAGQRDVILSRARYLSEAGAHASLEGVTRLINNYAYNTVNNTDPSLVVTKAQSYAVQGKAIRFLCWALQNQGTPLYQCPADADDDPETLVYVQAATPLSSGNAADGTYDYQIIFQEQQSPEVINSET